MPDRVARLMSPLLVGTKAHRPPSTTITWPSFPRFGTTSAP